MANFLSTQFFKYYKNQRLSDIHVKVQDQYFPCHRVILAASSQKLEKLIENQHTWHLELYSVSSVGFEACLDYIYTGKISQNMDVVREALRTASELQMFELIGIYNKYIEVGINRSNCLINLEMAMEQGNEEMHFIALEQVNRHAENLLSDKSNFLNLKVETLGVIFRSYDLEIRNESLLFQALAEWVAHDETREKEFCDLFQDIRLPLVSKDFIKNVISKHPHLDEKSDCYKCRVYFRQTLQYFIDGDKQDLDDLQTTFRNNKNDVVLISVYGDVKTFNFASNTLSDNLGLPQTSKQYSNTAVAIHDDIIYILGHELDTRAYYCDFKKNRTWQQLPNMPHDHNDHIFRSMVIAYGNSILIIGGFRNKAGINTIDCYDVDERKWVGMNYLNAARSNPTSVVHNGELYTIGGWHNGPLASVEKYNWQTKQWTYCKNLNQAREIPALESYKDKIFAVGGYTNQPISSAETYNAQQNVWTTVANLNVPRTQFGAFVVKGKLVIMGGHRNKGTRFYETWSEKHRSWKVSPINLDNVMHCKVLAYAR